jgi:hypothetical protein
VLGVEMEDDNRDHIARKLGMKLGKFASSIERITVRLSDANGPNGGRDQICQIKVVLSGLPSIVVEERAGALHTATERAMKATALAVRRSVQRRRLKALHHRESQPVATRHLDGSNTAGHMLICSKLLGPAGGGPGRT